MGAARLASARGQSLTVVLCAVFASIDASVQSEALADAFQSTASDEAAGAVSLLQHRAAKVGPWFDEAEKEHLPSVFVAVFSRRSAAERRSQIRGLWRYAESTPGLVTARFVVCRDEEDGLDEDLKQEYGQYKDVVVMPCQEGYSSGLLTRKVLASMQIYHQYFSDHKMFMKVDDDAFVAWPAFGRFLAENGGLNSYMGVPVGEARVCRNASYLWYEPYENWPEEMFPKGMAGGSGYVLGRFLVKLILGTGLGDGNVLYNEDRATAVWIKKLERSGTPVRWSSIPGIDGWWSWDYAHPTSNWKTWGEYYTQHLLHHGLQGQTISCLADAAQAGEDDRSISPCFEAEAGTKHEPLRCAELSEMAEKQESTTVIGASGEGTTAAQRAAERLAHGQRRTQLQSQQSQLPQSALASPQVSSDQQVQQQFAELQRLQQRLQQQRLQQQQQQQQQQLQQLQQLQQQQRQLLLRSYERAGVSVAAAIAQQPVA